MVGFTRATAFYLRRAALTAACIAPLHASGCSSDDSTSSTPPIQISGPMVLAAGQQAPIGLAVHGENVYWMNGGHNNTTNAKTPASTTGGQVRKCAIRSCSDLVTVLAADRQVGPSSVYPFPIVTDGKDVYWSDQTPQDDHDQALSGLFKCSVNGCAGAPRKIGTRARTLAVYDGRLYWTAGGVYTCKEDDCESTTSSVGPTPMALGIAVDATGVYWSTEGKQSVRSCALEGCDEPNLLDPNDGTSRNLQQVALTSTHVYIADRTPVGFGQILVCPKSGCNGNPVALASGLSEPNSIATDGVNVYWAETGDYLANGANVPNAGSIRKCAVTGCANAPTTIASAAGFPTGIAVDEWFVYWAEQGASETDGRIMMAPK
jgi:hypothetical protein